MFAQYAVHLEPVLSIDAIRTVVAIKTLVNKFTAAAVVENVGD
jgi:hypothetical protein